MKRERERETERERERERQRKKERKRERKRDKEREKENREKRERMCVRDQINCIGHFLWQIRLVQTGFMRTQVNHGPIMPLQGIIHFLVG